MTNDEMNIVIGSAAGGAILLSLVDFFIVHAKRTRAEREAAERAPGDPIIIRRPWPEAEDPPELVPEASPGTVPAGTPEVPGEDAGASGAGGP
jgi:hypothetical protein